MKQCNTCLYEPACKMWRKRDVSGECPIYNDSLQVIRKQTDAGWFDVNVSADEDYPGIDVEFIPDTYMEDNTYPTCPRMLFEYINEDGQLRVLVWSDKHSEDYTQEIIFDIGGSTNA